LRAHHLLILLFFGCGAAHGGAHDLALATTTGVPCAGVQCAPCADQFCDTSDYGKTGSCRAHVSATYQSFGCDGPEDCVAQGVFGACCFLDGIGAACASAGCGNGRFMCHDASQCAPGEKCCPLSSTTSYSACAGSC
jgi:hypothetical protein